MIELHAVLADRSQVDVGDANSDRARSHSLTRRATRGSGRSRCRGGTDHCGRDQRQCAQDTAATAFFMMNLRGRSLSVPSDLKLVLALDELGQWPASISAPDSPAHDCAARTDQPSVEGGETQRIATDRLVSGCTPRRFEAPMVQPSEPVYLWTGTTSRHRGVARTRSLQCIERLKTMGIKEACEAMFARHRVVAFDGAFHVPDVSRYPALFAWDSGYHVVVSSSPRSECRPTGTLDPLPSKRAPGRTPSHQRFIPGAHEHQRFIEELFGPMFVGDLTPFVDPPTAAYAAARLSRDAGPSADDVLSAAHAHMVGLIRLRSLDGGVLPVALHPFETGTENSVYVQSIVGDTEPSLLGHFKDLTISAIAAEMSPQQALIKNHAFVAYDPTVCGWHLLALEELELACHDRGWLQEAAWAAEMANAAASAIEDLLWWEEGHLFVAYDLVAGRQIQGSEPWA